MKKSGDIPHVDEHRLRWRTTPSSLLGEGSFGIVYRGKLDGSPVAIKIIKRSAANAVSIEDKRLQESAALKQHRREIHRFNAVRNPYIIQYLGVFRSDDPRDLYIVTEFLEGGSLHDSLTILRRRGATLDNKSFLTVANHIAWGLNHVHNLNYTHGDMKPQNVLLTSAFQYISDSNNNVIAFLPDSAKVKIADFGLSKRLEGAASPHMFGSTTATTDFGNGPVGTYLYMSPEGYKGVGNLSDREAKSSDVYAYGLVCFELLSSLQSWALEGVQNVFQLSNYVGEARRPSWGPRKSQIDPAYIALVEECWKQKSNDRPTVDEIVRRLEALTEDFERRAEKQTSGTPESMSNVSAPEDSGMKSSSEASSRHRASGPTGVYPYHEPINIHDQKDPFNGIGESTDSESESGDSDSNSEEHPEGQENRLRRGSNMRHGATHLSDDDVAVTDEHHRREADDADSYDSGASNDPLGIVHVESMRLTSTQAADITKAFLPRHKPSTAELGVDHDSLSNRSEREEKYESDVDINTEMNTLGIRDDVFDEDRDEIDANVIGIVPLRHVHSALIHAPRVEGLQLPGTEKDSRPVLGLGSVAQQGPALDVPIARSNSALLDSFIKAPLSGPQEQDAEGEGEPGHPFLSLPDKSSEKENASLKATEVDHSGKDGANDADVPHHRHLRSGPELSITAVLAEPVTKFTKRPAVREVPRTDVAESNKPASSGDQKTLSARKKNDFLYKSPSVVIDAEVLCELGENDDVSLADATATGLLESTTGEKCDIDTRVDPCHSKDNMSSHTLPSSTNPVLQKDIESTHQQQSQYNNGVQVSGQTAADFSAISSSSSHPEYHSNQARPHYPSHHNFPNSNARPVVMHSMAAAVPSVNSYVSLTSQGASAPPLSDTSHSALGSNIGHQGNGPVAQLGTPHSWQSPGTPHSRPIPDRADPHSSFLDSPGVSMNTSPVDVNALLKALQRPDGIIVAQSIWTHGSPRSVALALSKSNSLAGEDMLALACRFLAMNNDLPQDRKDPFVATYLCTAIGQIARNDSQAISSNSVLRSLKIVLLVMPNFCNMFNQHVEVFAASCFALCNLFKVYNVISDSDVRVNIALWIEYAISYNITNDGVTRGPFSEPLAYTATCAARNFMWMNEENVKAFVTCSRGQTTNGPPITRLIDSMRTFAYVGRPLVVESSLSALAMILHFPRQRLDFTKRYGYKVILDMLQYHFHDTKIVSLIFSMLTVTFSGPVSNQNESETFWKGFAIDHGVQAVVRSIDQMRRRVTSEQGRIDILERGFQTVLTVSRFTSFLRRSLIDCGVLGHVLATLRDLAGSALTAVQVSDSAIVVSRIRAATVLCDVVSEFCGEPNAFRYLRDNGVRRYLEDLMRMYPSDSAFVHSCRRALSVLY